MSLKILYEDDTELAEYEALNKGYRNDVIVIIGGKRYKVYITSLTRLQQDFETEQEDCGFYMAEPNTLLVNEVTKKEIENVITKMHQCKYFERLDCFGLEKESGK